MKVLDRLLKIFTILFIAFIYLPVFFVILLSFEKSSAIALPITGFTLDWYNKKPVGYETPAFISLFYDYRFWNALQNSLFVSFASALLTGLLVTASALALRHRVKGRDVLFYILLLGFIIPGVMLGLGNTFLYSMLGLEKTFWSVVLINVAYIVPFGLILMMARFDPDLMEYEHAASALKASPVNVFRTITLPLIKWEVISATIFGFLLSWGELIRTQFMLKGTGTISVFIYTQLSVYPLTPKWYAAGTLISIIAFVGLAIFAFILSRGPRS